MSLSCLATAVMSSSATVLVWVRQNQHRAAGDREAEMEAVLDMPYRKDKTREFRIRWKDYAPDWDSWEPKSHLNCDELLARFLEEKNNDVATLDNSNNGILDECDDSGDGGRFDGNATDDEDYRPTVT